MVTAEGFEFISERRDKPGMVGMVPGNNLSLSLFAKAEPFIGIVGGRHGAGRQKSLRCQDSEPTYCEQKQQICQDPAVHRRCQRTCGLCSPNPTQFSSRGRSSSVLWIAYLSSYQHMGRAMAFCSGGCTCGPIEIDAHAPSERISITAVQRLIVTHLDTGGRCLLRLTILPSTSSGEHKWKLIGLLLGENTAGDSWLPPGAMRSPGKGAGMFFPGLNERVATSTALAR